MAKPLEPDYSKEPFKEYCQECNDYVISLNNRCINNDAHITYILTDKELEDAIFEQENYGQSLVNKRIPKNRKKSYR